MALPDQPYLPFYVNQWLSNTKLKECSPAAHGLMINFMALAHKEKDYGMILLKQKYKQSDKQILNFALQFAKQLSFSFAQIEEPLQELISENVLKIEGDFLICERMVKDAQTSAVRALVGKKGGKKTQKKNKEFALRFALAKNEANYVNVIVNENVNDKEIKEGVGEKRENTHAPKFIVPEMLSIWKEFKPRYISQQEKDFPALQKIGDLISQQENCEINTPGGIETISMVWRSVCEFVKNDRFYSDYQISQVEKYFQNITSKMISAIEAPMTDFKKGVVHTNLSAAQKAKEILKTKIA